MSSHHPDPQPPTPDPTGPEAAGDGGASPKELWAEVGRHLQAFGRAVRTHLEPESPDAATWSPPPAGATADQAGDGPDDRWSDARSAARRLGRTAQQFATQAGEAVRDPAVRDSGKQAARSLGDALGRAAEDFGTQLRQNVRSPASPTPTTPPNPRRPRPPDTPPPPAAAPTAGAEPPTAPYRSDEPEPGPGEQR